MDVDYSLLIGVLTLVFTIFAAVFSGVSGNLGFSKISKEIEVYKSWIHHGSDKALAALHAKIDKDILERSSSKKAIIKDGIVLAWDIALIVFGAIKDNQIFLFAGIACSILQFGSLILDIARRLDVDDKVLSEWKARESEGVRDD